MAGRRWLFYATNGFGLGHVSRTLAVARKIRQREPEAEILFLTNSEAANLIWNEGFASVKLPSKESHQHAGLSARNLRWLNHVLAQNTFAAFAPDVTVVDSFPIGWTNEIQNSVRLQDNRVCICREKRPEVARGKAVQTALTFYDLILFPHHEGEADFPVPPGLESTFSGPLLVRSREEGLPRAEARRRLGLPPDGLVVYAGFGGGGDPEYARLADWVLSQAAGHREWTFALSVPPLGAAPGPDLPPNVIPIRYFPLAECWNAFDAAVSALGANTTVELLHNGIPALFLSRDVREDHHAGRLARILARNAGLALGAFDDAGLNEGLTRLRDPALRRSLGENARRLVPENGADRAADYLINWLESRETDTGRP